MNEERRDQILNAGMEAARDQLSRRQRGEDYPRDFNRLYEWLEDKLYALFEFILLKKTRRIFEAAGEIIVTASEIAEYANTEIGYEELMRKKEDE